MGTSSFLVGRAHFYRSVSTFARRPFLVVWLALAVLPLAVAGCFRAGPPQPHLFELEEGQTYGPVVPSPILIRLGQSVIRATGSVGPPDRPEGSAAIWEGHALALEPDRERNRTLFMFVEGDDLLRVVIQVNDHEPIVEESPGAYLSGEFSMVRWAQEYSLRVTAEDRRGTVVSSTIVVNGEDARVEGENGETPLRMRLLRMAATEARDVRGFGFRAKLYTHRWPTCGVSCDPTLQGGALVAMVSGPADTLALILDERYPFFATGLSYWPNPNYVLVAIPVRQENIIEIAALSEAGDLVLSRWDRPGL